MNIRIRQDADCLKIMIDLTHEPAAPAVLGID